MLVQRENNPNSIVPDGRVQRENDPNPVVPDGGVQRENDPNPSVPDDRVQPLKNCQHNYIYRGKCADCKIDVEICDRNCKKDHDCKLFYMYNGNCLACRKHARECRC